MTRPTPWRKSSHSGTQGDCVEVAHLEAQVGVRDSKDPEGGHLVLDRAAARTLVRRAKAGDLDL
ncbi:DUF397 domain-containing protein [Actinomadura sp. CNU-125]|uniref:DUF397 domain-containing protein n=1 Tax=Actinomadura sp. CNU-125 TaxID=1904961 RepID=UPI0021CCE33F|nr:DUF397 domain-containing protein [Actinomadura sp. CNU-125]